MAIPEKVVAFGTRVGGTVLYSMIGMIFVKGDDGEAYVLVGNAEQPSVGDTGILEFTPGGPKGGFWKFIPSNPRKPEPVSSCCQAEIREDNRCAACKDGTGALEEEE